MVQLQSSSFLILEKSKENEDENKQARWWVMLLLLLLLLIDCILEGRVRIVRMLENVQTEDFDKQKRCGKADQAIY